ncbi:PDZ domain-containing protein [Thalassospira sp. MA62]|nr:PDZ domain-containing protein [Thalassospira sp. MA62]
MNAPACTHGRYFGFARHLSCRWPRIGIVIGMCLVQVACGTPHDKAITTTDDPYTKDLMSQTIELVSSRYIDPISREQILVNALDGLTRIDDAIQIGLTPDSILLGYRGNTIYHLPLPTSSQTLSETENDSHIWSEMTLSGLAILRGYSARLRNSDAQDIQSALISGAIQNLDRYSRYEGPQKAETARTRRDGYIGIGVRVIGGNGYPVVKQVHDNSPAYRAGLHPGDQFVTINGQDMYGRSSKYATSLLHGEQGTRVVVEVNSSESQAITPMEILRERVIDQTVFPEIRDNILIARISSFNSATATSLSDAILKSQLYKGGLRGVVLDLRGNRGGLLQQGVAVADLFLQSGPIGNTYSRVTAARHVFEAENTDLSQGVPLVVLIDGRTASSAELVAAALQDRHRAVLIGSTSFGKGSVQAINDLPNHGTLTFTWSRMTAPSGYTFDRIGLFPAICTSTDSDTSALQQVTSALSSREKTAETLHKWRNLDYQDEVSRRALRNVCPAGSHAGEFDIDVAIELIKNHLDYRNLAFVGQQEIADTFSAH